MSGVDNVLIQYGALGVLAVIIYLITKTMMSSYEKMMTILQQMTSTLKSLQDNQNAMIRALDDITRRLESIEKEVSRP